MDNPPFFSNLESYKVALIAGSFFLFLSWYCTTNTSKLASHEIFPIDAFA